MKKFNLLFTLYLRIGNLGFLFFRGVAIIFSMGTKGWIALDIDGTITLDKFSVPEAVTLYLEQLQHEGWNIAIATGRPYAFASVAVSKFNFPFTFLLQNGSLILDLPSQTVLYEKYISSQSLPLFEQAFEGVDSDFLIYAGYEKGDFCYWRPSRFLLEDLEYLEDLQKRQKEKWQSVDHFKSLHLESFPLVKCFGTKDRMELVGTRLRATHQFQVAMIRDTFAQRYCVLLVTDKEVSKGASLKKLFHLKGRGSFVIAAGDDENDLSLLEAADLKIAMAHAPESLRRIADFIAPPTQEQGIIQALKQALRHAN